MIVKLYFGTDETRTKDIFRYGFTKSVIKEGDIVPYGKGYYFSRYASKSHYFTEGCGKLLLSLVALGRSKTVITIDTNRTSPPLGFDSILTPGRKIIIEERELEKIKTKRRLELLTGGIEETSPSLRKKSGQYIDKSYCSEEYVIFNGAQALPLYLICYEVIAGRLK